MVQKNIGVAILLMLLAACTPDEKGKAEISIDGKHIYFSPELKGGQYFFQYIEMSAVEDQRVTWHVDATNPHTVVPSRIEFGEAPADTATASKYEGVESGKCYAIVLFGTRPKGNGVEGWEGRYFRAPDFKIIDTGGQLSVSECGNS